MQRCKKPQQTQCLLSKVYILALEPHIRFFGWRCVYEKGRHMATSKL